MGEGRPGVQIKNHAQKTRRETRIIPEIQQQPLQFCCAQVTWIDHCVGIQWSSLHLLCQVWQHGIEDSWIQRRCCLHVHVNWAAFELDSLHLNVPCRGGGQRSSAGFMWLLLDVLCVPRFRENREYAVRVKELGVNVCKNSDLSLRTPEPTPAAQPPSSVSFLSFSPFLSPPTNVYDRILLVHQHPSLSLSQNDSFCIFQPPPPPPQPAPVSCCTN